MFLYCVFTHTHTNTYKKRRKKTVLNTWPSWDFCSNDNNDNNAFLNVDTESVFRNLPWLPWLLHCWMCNKTHWNSAVCDLTKGTENLLSSQHLKVNPTAQWRNHYVSRECEERFWKKPHGGAAVSKEVSKVVGNVWSSYPFWSGSWSHKSYKITTRKEAFSGCGDLSSV